MGLIGYILLVIGGIVCLAGSVMFLNVAYRGYALDSSTALRNCTRSPPPRKRKRIENEIKIRILDGFHDRCGVS